jgi:hypothetical protein
MANRVIVAQKLGLAADELDSLSTASGEAVAARLRWRYEVPDEEPLGRALADLGILSWAEATWLDGQLMAARLRRLLDIPDDASLVDALVDEGVLTEEEAAWFDA